MHSLIIALALAASGQQVGHTPGGGLPLYASAPTISPASGTFTTPQTVTISCSSGVPFYTTDGSSPTSLANLYSSALTVSSTMTVRAVCVVGSGKVASTSASSVITVTPTYTLSMALTSPTGPGSLPWNASGLYFARGGLAPTAYTYAATTDQIRIGSAGLLLERDTSPSVLTITPSASGGTLASSNYYYRVSALGSWGESAGGTERGTTVTGPTGSVAMTWSPIPTATGYRVYRGTAVGAESVYYAPGNVTSWTDTGAAATGGVPLAVGGITTEVMTLPTWRAFGTGHLFSGCLTITPEWDYQGNGLVRTVFRAEGAGGQYVWLYYASGPHTWKMAVQGGSASSEAVSAAQSFSANTSIPICWTAQNGVAPSLTVSGATTNGAANPGTLSPWDTVVFGSAALLNYGSGNVYWLTDSGSYAGGLDAAISNLSIDLNGVTAASKPAPTQTNVLCLGDSTTLGNVGPLSPTYPQTLGTTLGGGFTVTNGGVGGNNTFDMRARWRSTYRTLQGSVVLMAGTNDIAGGSTGEQAYVAWRLTAEEILASGARMMVVTPFPRTGLSSIQKTHLANLSAYQVQFAKARGLPYLDIYNSTTFNDGLGSFIPALTADGTHPTQAAANTQAAMVYSTGHTAGWW